MNIYKRNKFIHQFNIDWKNNIINNCPNKKSPFKNKYDEDTFIIKAYFSKYDCDSCNERNKCIKIEFDKTYYEVSINNETVLKEENNKKQESYKEKQYKQHVKKELKYFKVLKEKGSISEEDYIKWIYGEGLNVSNKAKEYNSKELFDFAIYINKLVIKTSINKFTGGAYVNIAENKVILNTSKNTMYSSKSRDLFKDKEVEECYLKALEIKSRNQVALHGIALYYFDIEEYDKSIKYFKEITDVSFFQDYINFTLFPIRHYYKLKVEYCIDQYKINSLLEFYSKLYDAYDKKDDVKIIIGWIYSMCAKYAEESLLSYNILRKIVDNQSDILKNTKFERYVYSGLAELCMGENHLNKPKEALKYYSKLYNIEEKNEFYETSLTNIVGCHIMLKQYEIAIEWLKKKEDSKVKLTNSDYYNLARAYFSLGNYEKALNNINKARYIFEDETSYLLASKINRKLGNIKEATDLAEKSLYFSEDFKENFSATKDGIKTYSIVVGDESTGLKSLYEELSLCYMLGKEYSKAYTINKLASEKYPDEIKFKDNIELIKQFDDIANENSVMNSNIKRLEEDKQIYMKQIRSTRNWIMELIQCQNNIILDDLNEDAWGTFEIRVKDILEEMKLEANKSNIKYEGIYMNLKERFAYISEEAFSFLSTAEYLYQYNKENFIDFAPIVIEFIKVFEVELNRVLKIKKKKTLGQILSDEFIRNSMLLSSILDEIEEFRKIRNSSAHTGLCTKEKVEILREKIYKTDILKQIVDAI